MPQGKEARHADEGSLVRRMSDDERDRKLAHIARLNAEELRGWQWGRTIEGRPYFDGERAALAQRARELSVREISN